MDAVPSIVHSAYHQRFLSMVPRCPVCDTSLTWRDVYHCANGHAVFNPRWVEDGEPSCPYADQHERPPGES